MTETTHVILAAHRATTNGRTLLVDDIDVTEHGIGRLSDSGIAPNDLWIQASGPPALHLAVLSAPRSARELFRVLALLERLIVPGGRILILPYVTTDGPENRFEATECFLGAYPGWGRQALSGNVIELRRAAGTEVKDEWLPVDLAPPVVARGPHKRVVSLAVWGDEAYHQYLPAYVRAHLTLFPGYELRIHHDETIFRAGYGGTLHGLQRRGLVRLVYMPSRPGQGKCERMLHRLLPAWDPEVEYVFSRDLDSLPTWGERCATEEFLASAERGETNLSTIHANIAHCGVMGGLCGFQTKTLRTLYPTFEAFIAAASFSDEKWATHGADQEFLNSAVAPRMRVFEHSIFKWFDEDGVTRRYRKPSEWTGGHVSAKFVTDIAPFEDAAVPVDIREPSDALVPYMGVAGYPHEKATAFYNDHCPVIGEIRAAEDATVESDHYDRKVEYAVISFDANPLYSFFPPLASLLWALRGYRPLLFLVGTAEQWLSDPRLRLAVERSREVGAEIHFVDPDGASPATAAQVVRLFGAAVPGIKNDEYLLTSDIDMLPLGPWVGGNRDADKSFQLYGANAAAPADRRYPICYLGASATTWRQVMGEGTVRDLLREAMAELDGILEGCNGQRAADEAWYFDERLFSRRLQAWGAAGGGFHQEIPRTFGPGERRIDRGDWRLPESLDGVADAHLPRPGFTDANWNLIRPLLALVLSEKWLAWADEYRAKWMEANND